MHPRLTVPLLFVGTVFTGCTFPSSRHVVSRHQVGQLQRIEYGTVQQMNPVVVEGERGQLGLFGGGITGAAAGGGVGHGVGRDLARAGGAVAGAVVGQATEEALTRKDAMEMIIKLESGSTVVLTQVQPPVVAIGDRVGVATGAGGARILLP